MKTVILALMSYNHATKSVAWGIAECPKNVLPNCKLDVLKAAGLPLTTQAIMVCVHGSNLKVKDSVDITPVTTFSKTKNLMVTRYEATEGALQAVSDAHQKASIRGHVKKTNMFIEVIQESLKDFNPTTEEYVSMVQKSQTASIAAHSSFKSGLQTTTSPTQKASVTPD